ncbi:hypothetical protein D3C77_711470 [compost metagenome]
MIPVGASIFTPSNIMGPSWVANPPRLANATGTSIRATSGDRRLLMTRYMKQTIIV